MIHILSDSLFNMTDISWNDWLIDVSSNQYSSFILCSKHTSFVLILHVYLRLVSPITYCSTPLRFCTAWWRLTTNSNDMGLPVEIFLELKADLLTFENFLICAEGEAESDRSLLFGYSRVKFVGIVCRLVAGHLLTDEWFTIWQICVQWHASLSSFVRLTLIKALWQDKSKENLEKQSSLDE